MRKIIIIVIMALGIALPASGQFDFRTTGTRSMRVAEITCTPTAAPAVSAANMAKLFVPCSGITGYNAGNIYISQNTGAWTLLSSFVGSGAVTSVFSRTGTITAQAGDYAVAQVTGAAPLASPALTGTPTAPTAAAATNTTQIATTAFVQSESLNATEADALFLTPAEGNAAYVTPSSTTTLTNKTIALGSNTITGTSAQLATAISDETGTGVAVFATSPTLVTPTLGAATATSVTAGALTSTGTITAGANGRAIMRQSASGDTEVGGPAGSSYTAIVVGGSERARVDASSLISSGSIKERGRSAAIGEWTAYTPTLSAATGTWTAGSFVNCKYMVVGKTMYVSFKVVGSSVSTTTQWLNVTIPGGYTSAGEMNSAVPLADNGVVSTGWLATSGAGGTGLTVFKDILGAGTFAASSGNTRIAFTATLEIQ